MSIDLLAQRIRDPVEDVRQKAVATACEIAKARPHILTEAALDELFLRMRDRKVCQILTLPLAPSPSPLPFRS
jgi:HEAT repeat protein